MNLEEIGTKWRRGGQTADHQYFVARRDETVCQDGRFGLGKPKLEILLVLLGERRQKVQFQLRKIDAFAAFERAAVNDTT